MSTSKFRHQASIGEVTAGVRLSGGRFRLLPGFLGATEAAGLSTIPVAALDLQVLFAKTDPLGLEIRPQEWERHNTPIFIWEPPQAALDVAGYSYAIDGSPDDVPDTTETSLNIATRVTGPLTDGKHTFSVKAVNTAGNTGKPISFGIWVDTTPPEIVTYTPTPGSLVNTSSPVISATVSDVGSGVTQSTVGLFSGSTPILFSFNEAAGVLTASEGRWREGVNSVELRVADAVGNAQVPLVWSMTIDTKPPTGTVMMNGGAATTTSIYVTLSLSASDATSGIARMLVSNEEAVGYVEEPYASQRPLWKLNPIRGRQTVYVKFVDNAGNVSPPYSDDIDLILLSPETVITSGPAGVTPNRTAAFSFMCPEGNCVYSYSLDTEPWSEWGTATTVTNAGLAFGNHYFRVKAAKDVNGITGIQPNEEDPSPAERTWIIGVESPIFSVPKGPPIKLWRVE